MALTYILITAARNEEAHIEKTIQSVVSQTILPEKWIIVSDGSSDRTDEIVKHYTAQYPWIVLLRMPEHKKRNFASKAHSVNTGYQRVKNIDSDIIANLDADISFEKDFFEFLLEKFLQIPELGIAGTRYIEKDNEIAIYSFKDVAGQCQMFRRQCFKDIGEGYTPMKHGCIDNVAVIAAQMKGWKTITFDEKTFFHHRPMGTANRNKWTSILHYGRKDYILGNHPLWEVSRIIFRMARRPYLIGGMLLLLGHIRAFFSHTERIPKDLIDFRRKEQIKRLKLILNDLIKFKIRIEET